QGGTDSFLFDGSSLSDAINFRYNGSWGRYDVTYGSATHILYTGEHFEIAGGSGNDSITSYGNA
ncbi:MAG: hypothetical protein KDJ77_15055, partial [Rhodobiaceae bacterium]|nr:hypothetical protein [Rhodobiaceae bacterium]